MDETGDIGVFSNPKREQRGSRRPAHRGGDGATGLRVIQRRFKALKETAFLLTAPDDVPTKVRDLQDDLSVQSVSKSAFYGAS